ncbi:MAG: cytosol nonspecific dipeptidase [Ignavibacteriales bacterium CG_4_9_14_3_um_filter_30_11]|nr:MAG: cytosol nonspecific dipeptidase [Ignavibacteriales bacterium CG_4_9_14_3_um_filter_30_11]
MSEATKGLEPKILWERFSEIAQIPRPSKKEEKIRKHMRELLDGLKIKYKEDKVGNIVASIPSKSGYEKTPIIVLQGHIDMVCEKDNETKHDFDNDPIKLIKDGEWIKADGTTLGSDNGIGVAAALALITDKDAVHGPLEILMTIDEETGLTGASNLEPGFVTGKTLLNLDSEEDGAFYVGCSGGVDTIAEFDIEWKKVNDGNNYYKLVVTGLKGGHSGLDIHTGRGNAIKILGRTLNALESTNYSIVSLEGGNLRNAIPREAEAIIAINKSQEENAKNIINEFQKDILNEFKTSDGNVKVTFSSVEVKTDKVFGDKFKNKIIDTILALPHGVIAMSQDLKDLVETSTNVATVHTNGDLLKIGTSQRSSINSANQYIARNVRAIFNLAGGRTETNDGYPGWKPNLDSAILKTSKEVFKEIFNKEPEIKAIHAGLECGILEGKNPGMDMVSFGPTIQGAHSPNEKVNIPAVEKFYNLLKGILKKVTENN